MSEEEDLEVDNVFDPKRKKSINSGRKGKSVERMLVKILNERFGGGFSRSVGSGNRWGQVSNLPKHALDSFSGDLVCPEDFTFVIECKGGYEDIDLNSALEGGIGQIDNFLKQSEDESARTGRKPILAWKKNRKPWIVFLKTVDLPHLNWEYRVIYREWSGVCLKEFLEIENEYFYSNWKKNGPSPSML